MPLRRTLYYVEPLHLQDTADHLDLSSFNRRYLQ